MYTLYLNLQIRSSSGITLSHVSTSPKAPPRRNKTAFSRFITSLNLTDKYPQKLQLINALSIRMELLNTKSMPNEIQVFPYLVLQKIMMYDNYRPLCKLMSTNNSQFRIHPVDILLALLHCSDDILRQDLLSRLHICKLAIPFLLTDHNNKTITLLLWAMRSIVCEWKCKEMEDFISRQCSIVDYKGPIVSFLRVGNAKSPKHFSKSRIINAVIGDQNYFFHWNNPGGSFQRNFVDGLVELSCYLPSGKDNDNFPDAVIFLNLRGEGCDHTMQLDFLKKISFIIFVVLLEESLDDSLIELMQELANVQGGLVIIFPDYEHTCTLPKSKSLLNTISAKHISTLIIEDMNEDEVKSHIQKIISKKMSKPHPFAFKAISECSTIAHEIGIRIDEDNIDCKEGKILANDMIKVLNDVVPASDAKARMLPLQGPELWHKWAKYEKESFQKPNKEKVTVPFFNKTVEDKKIKIRQKQRDHTKKLTPLMHLFTNSLKTCKTSARIYVLQWLKLLLDDRSRKILPEMRAEYERIRTDLMKLKEEGNSVAVKSLVNDLKKQNRLLIEGSLGLEHLFREVGQMYEAVKDLNKQPHAFDYYPKMMVYLLNQGYSIELMDGDASHVPVTWVSAVLEELKSFYKRNKLFVISVLGIQSTGKSTLLNTMFGLQFNVSAGRCTRGAFMQLLPVEYHSDSFQNSIMCDYVLIIDTEGLRAPELYSNESYLHDNELATFVIGLADVAIINIYGESPGDLNDILQTAVHAFIRMKNVSVNLNCHFVHQNVTALLVDSKIKFGQQAFQDKLDEMTKYAAIAEHCESKYRKFQDVIKFEGATDITYFPGLWKGDPPMAPVNSGYSDKALQVKSALMKLANFKMKENSSFDNFQLLLDQLWCAVCRENYIFSFKNTKEIVAYNELDKAFSQWSWMLNEKMVEWNNNTGNAISNCALDRISITVATCLKKADNMLQEFYVKLTKEMKVFFEESEHSDTLAQWKHRYITRLEHLKEDCKDEAKKHCEVLKLERESRVKLEALKEDYRKQVLDHIQQLATHAKENQKVLTQPELERKFDEKWQDWINEFSTEEYQNMYISNDGIEAEISNVLHSLLARHNLLISKLQKTALSKPGEHDVPVTINPNSHLKSYEANTEHPAENTSKIKKFTTFLNFGKDKSKKENDNTKIKDAQKKTDGFFATATSGFSKIKKKNFDKKIAFTSLKKFIDEIESYNEKNDYMFTSEYIVDMAIAFASYMTTEYINLMDEVRKDNNPMEHIKRLRKTYLNTFLVQYKEVCGDEIAAKNLCNLLSVAIEAAVIQILPTKIAVHMKNKNISFCQKIAFKVKVLKDLAEEKKFELFKTYLVDIKRSFLSWVERYVKEFCTENNKKNLKTIVKSIVHVIIEKIGASVKHSDETIPMKQWLQQFHQNLNETMTINLSEMEDIIAANKVQNSSKLFVSTLSEQLLKQEDKTIKAIVDPAADSKFSDITKWSTSPHITLCDSLIGCTAQCPFCGEQCELTDPNHLACGKKHFMHIHRPVGLGKYTWHESQELVLDICTYSIDPESGHKFKNRDTNNEWVEMKDYQTIYKDWYISNMSPKEAPRYWQWFISHYLKDITEWVGASSSSSSISEHNWGAVTQKMAVASLHKVYKMT